MHAICIRRRFFPLFFILAKKNSTRHSLCRLFSIRPCLHTMDCIHYGGFFLYVDFHDRLLHRKSFFASGYVLPCHKTTAKINLHNVTSHTQIWYLDVVFLYCIPVSYYVSVRLESRISSFALVCGITRWPVVKEIKEGLFGSLMFS